MKLINKKCYIFSFIIVFILIITLFLSLFYKYNYKNYISITTTSNEGKTYFYTYNINKNYLEEKLVINDNSQYPLGIVDEKNNYIYYIQYYDGLGDQVFQYNLKNKNTNMITEDFEAINSIYPIKDKLYLLARTKLTDGRISLIEYNLKNNKYKVLTNLDTEVRDMYYNKYNNKLYYSCYSWSEQMKLKKQFEENPKIQPEPLSAKNSIFSLDINTGEFNKVFEFKGVIKGFTPLKKDGEFIIKLSYNYLFGKSEIIYLNTLTNQKKDFKINNINGAKNFLYYDNGIFFTGFKDNNYNTNDLNINSSFNSWFYMDLDTNKIKEIKASNDYFNKKYINNNFIFIN